MKAIDKMLVEVKNSKVVIISEGDRFAASIVICQMDIATAIDSSVDKAMWELNGMLVEQGIKALAEKAGFM